MTSITHRYLRHGLWLALLLGLNTLAYAQIPAQPPTLIDCSQARDKTRCEGRLKAQLACQDKRGHERQLCLIERMPLPDCSQAEDRERCEHRQEIRKKCYNKFGRELRACLRENHLD
jgi:hypothetical protein